MSEPRWLSRNIVEAIHDAQLVRFGGAPGTRDVGLLESAIGRPRNKWAYEDASLEGLAAAYAFAIARNHPFIDGNKRTAFMAAYVFLRLNGISLEARNAEVLVMTRGLAAGEIDEQGYTMWIADRIAQPEYD